MFVANNVVIFAIIKKIVRLKNYLFENKIITIKFKKMFYVFQFFFDLFSILQITKHNNLIMFDKNKCFIREKIFN